MALALTGCGSLRPHEDIVRAAGGTPVEQGRAEAVDQGGSGGLPSSQTGGLGTTGSTGQVGTGAGSGSTGTATGTTGAGPGGTSGSTSGTGGGGGTTGPLVDRGVVTIGNVSTKSGVAGGAQRPGFVGFQAWVAATNAKGGVNGHLIKLISRDDQNDPNQNASYTQALVEQGRVVAFVSNWASNTQAASADYLRDKGIPVIGGDHTGHHSWGENPMFFPTAALGQNVTRNSIAALAHVAVPAGKKNLAIFVCVEGDICTRAAKTANEIAPKLGFKVAYNGSASFAAPNYTAECLAMRNAGVQAIAPVFPASAVKNIARDCNRQGLEVIYSLANGVMEGDFHKDPNFEGSAVNNSAFPFGASSSAVQREYQAAMKKYAPDQISNPASASGFASGVVFGAALAKVKGPVTSAKLLAALRTFNDATFDGATIPLTYRNGPMVPPPCYFLSVINQGAYSVQNGGRYLCVNVR